jgi:hypothetical protein
VRCYASGQQESDTGRHIEKNKPNIAPLIAGSFRDRRVRVLRKSGANAPNFSWEGAAQEFAAFPGRR